MKILEKKSERISTRVTLSQKNVIARAAYLRGRTITEFMVDSAQREAEKVIDDMLVIRLAEDHQNRLIDALLHPSEPNDALKAAAKHYDDTFVMSK